MFSDHRDVERTAWRIQRLEDDLYTARHTIISLMPDNVQSLLQGYYRCETREESYTWKRELVSELIALAEPIPEYVDSPWFGQRAFCPLCGDGAMSGYQRGFGLSEGLRRHLTGWGNTRRCRVMEAVLGLARDYWDRKFAKQEAAEREAESERLKQRRQTETMFQLGPKNPPQLVDEQLYRGTPRNNEELQWAEQRLVDIGFQVQVNGRIKAYTQEHDKHVVYADPRAKGRIEFYVYPKHQKPRRTRFRRSFYMLDTWKHDLKGKYLARVGIE